MMRFTVLSAALALSMVAVPATAQQKAGQQPQPKPGTTAPGQGVFGTASKEPISIEADSLEVFDRDQKAVYKGNVIVVQGDTTMKSAEMVVFYARGGQAGAARSDAAGQEGTNVRRVEAFGGVTIMSKDQVASGRDGVFDRENNRVVLTGDVTLSQGGNITKGERLNYDLSTGQATVEARASTGRVRSLLVPGSEDGAKPLERPAAPPAARQPAPTAPVPAPSAPQPPVRP